MMHLIGIAALSDLRRVQAQRDALKDEIVRLREAHIERQMLLGSEIVALQSALRAGGERQNHLARQLVKERADRIRYQAEAEELRAALLDVPATEWAELPDWWRDHAHLMGRLKGVEA